jgi:hypothetical protein
VAGKVEQHQTRARPVRLPFRKSFVHGLMLQYDRIRICCEYVVNPTSEITKMFVVHEGCTLHSADSVACGHRSKHVNTNTNTTRDGRPNKCFAL